MPIPTWVKRSPDVLNLLLEEYDRYIQEANDEQKYDTGWKPACINEFFDCEFQEILETIKDPGHMITSVSKSDIEQACLDADDRVPENVAKRLEDITPEEISRLASKLADDYCNQLFWSSLRILFTEYFMEEQK